MPTVLARCCLPLLLALLSCAGAADFDTRVPMARASSGNYLVQGVLGRQVEAEFLVDTGSGLVTVNERVFRAIKREQTVERVREMAARLADGSLRAMPIYRVARFRLGERCEVGPVEIAVLGRDGRNILGLSVLNRLAPFAVHAEPPALSVSDCDLGLGEALAAAP